MNNDPAALVAPSSIALLQERFRQLQRVKQMREERELLKFLSLSSNYPNDNNQLPLLRFPTVTATAVRTFFWHPELAMMIAAAPQTSLSVQPDKFRVQVPSLVNLWPAHDTIDASDDHSAASLIRIDDDDDDNDDSDSCSDVDTSLHL